MFIKLISLSLNVCVNHKVISEFNQKEWMTGMDAKSNGKLNQYLPVVNFEFIYIRFSLCLCPMQFSTNILENNARSAACKIYLKINKNFPIAISASSTLK